MINFNKNSVFNLKPIGTDEVNHDLHGLLLDGEEIIMAFKTTASVATRVFPSPVFISAIRPS